MPSAIERASAAAALVLILCGLLFLVSAASAAQTYQQDVQRQLDRLQLEVDRMGADLRRMDQDNERVRRGGFERLAALEREMELNQRIIFGLALPVVGQAVFAFLTWRRVNGKRGPW